MIALNNISKKYGKKVIFDKSNLIIEDPGLYIVKGVNGVGKTTLLNIMGKFISYKGRMKNEYLNNMGYVFYNNYLIEYLTIKEHLDLFKIDYKVLEKFNLIKKLDAYPDSLSSGEKQRISIIITLYSNNNLILLDEPFSNLDIETSLIVYEVIREFKQSKIIIIINHCYKINNKDINGIITLKDSKIYLKNKTKNNNKINQNISKNKLNDNYYKKGFIKYKKYYFKLFLFVFLLLFLLNVFSITENIMTRLVKEDIDNSVDYNKFYLKKCEDFENKGFKVLKCSNPDKEDLIYLKENNVIYGYNYDYLLNYLYNSENLAVVNNSNVKLKQGRYPLKVSEVLASDKYNVGDLIELKSNILVKDKKTDVYNKELLVEVVGIYNNLNFYNEDNIYFDYYFIEEYFKNEKFVNNNFSVYEYFVNLDISNYKYLSFSKIDTNRIIFEGEKDSFYLSLNDVIYKIIELVNSFKIIIILFMLYNVYRILKFILTVKQKSIAFLLANSFSKKEIIVKESINFLLNLFVVFIVNLFINFMFTKNLVYFKESIVLCFYILVIEISITYIFYSRKSISRLMREELW